MRLSDLRSLELRLNDHQSSPDERWLDRGERSDELARVISTYAVSEHDQTRRAVNESHVQEWEIVEEEEVLSGLRLDQMDCVRRRRPSARLWPP